MAVLADSYRLGVFEISFKFQCPVDLIQYSLSQASLGRQPHFQLSLQCMIISSLWSCASPMHMSWCCHEKMMTVLFLAGTYGVR